MEVARGNVTVSQYFKKTGNTRRIKGLLKFTLKHGWPSLNSKLLKNIVMMI